MSVSNHRPYTYPAGRIPIPNDAKSRAGGVMYSDYALGGFLEIRLSLVGSEMCIRDRAKPRSRSKSTIFRR